jgi:hypothetical protein
MPQHPEAGLTRHDDTVAEILEGSLGSVDGSLAQFLWVHAARRHSTENTLFKFGD